MTSNKMDEFNYSGIESALEELEWSDKGLIIMETIYVFNNNLHVILIFINQHSIYVDLKRTVQWPKAQSLLEMINENNIFS